MKKFKSLRMKVTILVGIIILLTALCLTLFSIFNANRSFNVVAGDVLYNNELGLGSILNSNTTVEVPLGGSTLEVKQQFAYSSFIYMVVIVICGMSMTYYLLGKLLKPIQELSEMVQDINEHNLSLKIDKFKTNDEIGMLTQSFNTMLERLEQSFVKQKNFATNAAHELKTPLALMKSSIQVLNLEDDVTLEDYKEQLEIMEYGTNRLISIVDDLFEFSFSQFDCFDDAINIKKVIEEVEKELDVLANQKEVTLKFLVDNLIIYGNSNLIYRVFYNLIENAIKYNKAGGNVEVIALRYDENIRVIVRDSGIGIASENLNYIFDPFYRVDKSRSRNTGGAGVGLALVREILIKHGAKIKVKSILDEGTEFTIIFKMNHDNWD